MEEQQPICLQNMSPTKNGKIFFNESTGSSSKLEEDIEFEYGAETPAAVSYINKEHPHGTFTLVGRVRWYGEP